MSLQTTLLMTVSFVLLVSMLTKWKNVLLIILLLESLSAVSLASVLNSMESNTFMLTLFPFYVSEALILLTAFYSTMRMVGSTFSNVVTS